MDNRPEWGVKISKYMPIPQRIIMALMGFLSVVNAYTMRICISISLTRIVKEVNSTDNKAVCDPPPGQKKKSHVSAEGYDWDQELQGLILCSFYMGYIITHVPGGLLCERFGAKWVLGLGLFSTSVFTALTPVVTLTWGPYALIALRILMGVGEGTTFPALGHLIAQWVPQGERGKLGALILGGGPVGSIIGNTLSGFLLDRYHWASVFYTFAIGGFLWFIFCVLLVFSDPASHPYIKDSELSYIMEKLGRLSRKKDLAPTPWKLIFTNKAVWGLLLGQLGHDWGLFVMLTDLPKYMNDVMNFSIKSNGILSSLPWAAMWLCAISWGFVTDWMINSSVVSVTFSRKLNSCIAAFGPGILMVCASYAGCNHFLVVVFFTASMLSMGPYYSGMKLTAMDLSPNYSGTIMALANGIASTTGIISPYMIGVLTPNTALSEWRLVFWITLFILALSAVLFVIFAEAAVQPFDDPENIPKSENK